MLRISLISFFGLSVLPSLLAQTVSFSTTDGYLSGPLDNNPNWDASGSPDSIVNASGSGTVLVDAYSDAVFLPAISYARDDVFETYIDFTFTAATTTGFGTANYKPFLNVGFFDTDATGNMLKLGFNRSAQNYAISIQTNWANYNTPPFTGGSSVQNGIPATDVGVNRDTDLESDLLRLHARLTRGSDNDDWDLTGTLYNVSSGTPIQLAQLTATGITFNTSFNIAAGFGGGQSDSNAVISNRVIEDFFFKKTVTGTPPPPPANPPATGPAPADLNQNGIPDLDEITNPLIALFPPAEDSDGDGQSNIDELKAGTDPFDPNSLFGASDIAYTSGTSESIDFTFASVPGVRYIVQASETLDTASWTTLTPEVTASQDLTTLTYDPSTFGLTDDRCFFRAGILPSLDTDLDGLEDSLELYLGYDINSSSSARSSAAGGDYAQFFNLITGASPNGGLMNNTSVSGIPSDEQAARFLNQTTFGATQAEINSLRALGNNAYELWIDQQLALPANSFASPYTDLTSERRLSDYNTGNWDQFPHKVDFQSYWADYLENLQTAWTRLALFAPDQLRQRTAWALSQIMVAGPDGFSHARAQAEWYDTCLRNALGNYRTLLYEISVNPWMGAYLSHEGNLKADPTINRMPDENFAREIMQLFSIGLWELNMDGSRRLDIHGEPIPTYTNDDITQVARVFTGLRRNFDEYGTNPQDIFSTAPMKMSGNNHDTGDSVSVQVYGAAEKIFLQSPFYSPTPLPAFSNDPGRTGLDDVSDTVDILFNHPNCPPFICKQLIQFLITSNPSLEYVERISNVFVDDGTGTRGNLAAVVKAIILDEEARNASSMLADHSGRLKGPMLRLTTLCRIYKVGSATPAINDLSGIQAWNPSMSALQEDFKQAPHQYPSVFNFYQPSYARPGDVADSELLSPGFQILDSAAAITLPNRIWTYLDDGVLHTPHPDAASATPDTSFDFSIYDALADDSHAILDQLNTLICQGQMCALTRTIIANALDSAYPSNGTARTERIKLATYLVTISHDGAILK